MPLIFLSSGRGLGLRSRGPSRVYLEAKKIHRVSGATDASGISEIAILGIFWRSEGYSIGFDAGDKG